MVSAQRVQHDSTTRHGHSPSMVVLARTHHMSPFTFFPHHQAHTAVLLTLQITTILLLLQLKNMMMRTSHTHSHSFHTINCPPESRRNERQAVKRKTTKTLKMSDDEFESGGSGASLVVPKRR